MTASGSSLLLQQTIGIARRILTEYLRQRRTLIFWAVFPALMLLLFGLIYGNNPSMPGSMDTTPAGILIGAALFFSCLGGTVSIIVAERERRTLRRLLVSPLSPRSLFPWRRSGSFGRRPLPGGHCLRARLRHGRAL